MRRADAARYAKPARAEADVAAVFVEVPLAAGRDRPGAGAEKPTAADPAPARPDPSFSSSTDAAGLRAACCLARASRSFTELAFAAFSPWPSAARRRSEGIEALSELACERGGARGLETEVEEGEAEEEPEPEPEAIGMAVRLGVGVGEAPSLDILPAQGSGSKAADPAPWAARRCLRPGPTEAQTTAGREKGRRSPARGLQV